LRLERLQLLDGRLDSFLRRRAAEDPSEHQQERLRAGDGGLGLGFRSVGSFWTTSAVPLASAATCSAAFSSSDAHSIA
jgi:hypothetical protein